MSAPRYCSQCGKLLHRDQHGDPRCEFGHPQSEAADLVGALRDLVPVLLEVRESIEQQGLGVRFLHEEVKALRLERITAGAAEYNDLATEARRIGRSRDWLRDHARELGGWQAKPRGRWYFQPAVTDARLAALDGVSCSPAASTARPSPPRQLPGSAPLLPVKDRAA